MTDPAKEKDLRPSETCPNCGFPATEAYCASCGQKRGDLFPSVRQWVVEGFEELIGVDAKLPRTLKKLVWPPGELTREWGKGRRAQYVSPLRLYLAAAFLLFLAWPQTPLNSSLDSLIAGAFEAEQESRGLRGEEDGMVDRENPVVQETSQRVRQQLPLFLLILFVPVFAGLLFVVNWGRGRFVGNLIAAFHLHSISFLCLICTVPFTLVFGESWVDWGMFGVLFGLLAFMAISLKRIHETGTALAIVRTLIVAVLYPSFMAIATVGALMVLWQQG
jgi:hypothetical protein